MRSHRGFAHHCSRRLCWRPSAGIQLDPQKVHIEWRNLSTSERARETTPPTIKQSARQAGCPFEPNAVSLQSGGTYSLLPVCTEALPRVDPSHARSMLAVNRYCPRTPAPRLVVQPANYTGRIVREGAVLAKRLPVCPCALRADASARKPRSSLPLPTRASRARRLAAPARASADVLTGIARLGSQAHLGVRLKKDGYKVIGADWKKQEYFEEVTPPSPLLVRTPRMPPGLRESGRQERVGQGVAVHCA